MHYYEFHVGDYRKQTGHLTHVEHSIYRSLLDTYYQTELPLDLNLSWLMRAHNVRTSDEKEAFNNVLTDFFIRTTDGYRHEHCDKVLAKVYKRSESARIGAMVRWENKRARDMLNNVQSGCVEDANASETDANASKSHATSMLPTTHYPIPTTQDTSEADEAPPKRKNGKKSKAKKLNFDLDDMALATHMHDGVKQHYPEQKISLDHWANGVRMLRRIDNRDIDNLRSLWDWAMAHDKGPGNFSWCKNIRSPFKLRDKKDGITYYDIIAQQMGDDILSATGYQGKIQTGENKTVERLTNRTWAKDLIID